MFNRIYLSKGKVGGVGLHVSCHLKEVGGEVEGQNFTTFSLSLKNAGFLIPIFTVLKTVSS